MASLKGTKTAENLMKAFAGESQARNRYTFFASVAKKEGYIQISNFFLETAANEKEHAETFYKYLVKELDGQAVTITADFPVTLGDTKANLRNAAAGENEEWSDLYPEFAKVAAEEGFLDVAENFRRIAEAERYHEKRYLILLENLESGKIFKRDEKVEWRCGNCGYVITGSSAPEKCPACAHPKGYFELYVENY